MMGLKKEEWRLIIIISLVLILITVLPFLFGYLKTPPGKESLGIHAIAPGDIFVYYSYIEQIKQGHYFLGDLFTAELQPAHIFNWVWLWVGLIARTFNLGVALSFHLCRLLCIPFLVFSAYLLIKVFIADWFWRRLSLILLFFGAGVGAWSVPFLRSVTSPLDPVYRWPLDLWAAESNVFLSIFQSPHFILSWCFLFLTFYFLLRGFWSSKMGSFLAAGITGLVLFNFHPYHAPTIYLVSGVYLVAMFIYERKIEWQKIIGYVLFLLISGISVFYHYFLIRFDHVIGARAIQNFTPTPPLLYVILGFGFLFIFSLLAFWLILKRKIKLDKKILFLVVWFLCGLALVYLPFNFQSRLAEGWQLPLTILTIYFFIYLKDHGWFQSIFNLPVILAFFLLLFFGFSPLFNLTRDLKYYWDQDPAFYVDKDNLAAIDWLKNKVEPGQTTLPLSNRSSFVPAFAGRSIYFGHYHETIDATRKAFNLIWFAKNDDATAARKFLVREKIDYVFVDRGAIKNSERFRQWDFLSLVYENSDELIYRFTEGANSNSRLQNK